MAKILVVEDKPSMRKMLKTNLEIEGYIVIAEKSATDAINVLSEDIDLILSDLKMEGMDGIEFLRYIRQNDINKPFILMTAFAKIKDAVEAMKLGATDFIEKPFEMDYLLFLIKKIIKWSDFQDENTILKAFTARSNEEINIVGNSDSLRKVMHTVEKVAQTDSSVIFYGESGTGKEIFAKYLHYQSKRKDNPFVAINCAAIPSELMESELFGYEKGAFTSADSKKIGLFEIAKNGTIFLDEIGELPLNMQSKLLRVIQEREFLRVGGIKPIKTDARIISATNQNLNELVEKKLFREDLYYRVSVIPIIIPSLCERKDDIPILIDYFIEKFAKDFRLGYIELSESAKKILLEYNYKGNIRQLKNIIERAVILCENGIITSDILGIIPEKKEQNEYIVEDEFDENAPLNEITEKAVKYAESKHILKVLKKEKWNRSNASKILQISYKTLLTKIKDYNLIQ